MLFLNILFFYGGSAIMEQIRTVSVSELIKMGRSGHKSIIAETF